MRRPAAVLLLACWLLVGGCGGGSGSTSTTDSPPAAPAGPPAGFLGVTAGTTLAEQPPSVLEREMRLMRATGATSLRQAFYWDVLEPERGRFSFGTSDTFMRAAARAGIDVLPVLVGTPGWAVPPGHPPFATPPRSPADFATFAAAVVRRYRPGGAFWRANPALRSEPVRAWQVWNEPNHLRYWNEQPFDRGYVRLARAARSAIKGADPHALVVSAGFAERSWDLIAGMERAGAKGLFDVIAIHPYTFEPQNVLKIVEFVRTALRRAGQGAVPLWATEVTWSSGLRSVKTPLGFETTERDQAHRLTRAFRLLIANARRLNLRRAYWESWLTEDANRLNTFDYSGLRQLRPGGTVRSKPAFRAFRDVARRLGSGRP